MTKKSSEVKINIEDKHRTVIRDLEIAYFTFYLEKMNGNVGRIAQLCEIERTNLYRKLKRLGIDFNKYRKNKCE